MYFDYMSRNYGSILPSGKSQQQGGDNETGVRQESPRKQEKPDVILPVNNNRKDSQGHAVMYDKKEYERRVKAVLEGNILESTIRDAADMLSQQTERLRGIPLDVMRNNCNKLVNQDMDVTPLEEANRSAEHIL